MSRTRPVSPGNSSSVGVSVPGTSYHGRTRVRNARSVGGIRWIRLCVNADAVADRELDLRLDTASPAASAPLRRAPRRNRTPELGRRRKTDEPSGDSTVSSGWNSHASSWFRSGGSCPFTRNRVMTQSPSSSRRARPSTETSGASSSNDRGPTAPSVSSIRSESPRAERFQTVCGLPSSVEYSRSLPASTSPTTRSRRAPTPPRSRRT